MISIQFTGSNFKDCLSFIGSDGYDNSMQYPNVITPKGAVEVFEGDIITRDDVGALYVSTLRHPEPVAVKPPVTGALESLITRVMDEPGTMVPLSWELVSGAREYLEVSKEDIHIIWSNDKYFLFRRG